jgi:DNA excision repair protein ERCC-6
MAVLLLCSTPAPWVECTACTLVLAAAKALPPPRSLVHCGAGDEVTETEQIFGTINTGVDLPGEAPAANGADAAGAAQMPDRARQASAWQTSGGRAASARQGSARRAAAPAAPAAANSGSGSGSTAQQEAAADGPDEARMLRDLFEGAALAGIVDHAAIEGANEPEARYAAQEAAKIAAKAAAQLKASRRECSGNSVGVPTWTGRHGAAGAPNARQRQQQQRQQPAPPAPMLQGTPAAGQRPRFGGAASPGGPRAPAQRQASASLVPMQSPDRLQQPGAAAAEQAGRPPAAGLAASNVVALTSSALLSQIRARQLQAKSAGMDRAASGGTDSAHELPGASRQQAAAGQPPDSEAGRLAAEIVAFLEARNGTAESAVLIQAFQGHVPAAKMPVFRALLKQLAVLQTQPGGGTKVWRLRPEFAS